MNLIEVDMTSGGVVAEALESDMVVGGRALIDWYMAERVSPDVHPLSGDNPFIVAPGLFAGTSTPTAGRLSVGGKSPLTGGIKEANVGGTAAHKLGRLGVQGVVVRGRADDWRILRLDTGGPRLEPAGDIVGLDNYDACERLRQRYGDQVGIIIIGVGGERLHANSTVAVTDLEGRPCRHAARGGVGAIMGSKGLKAVVIDDSGTQGRRGIDHDAFREAARTLSTMLRASPYTDILHNSSTAFFVNADNARGSLPTNNHRSGSFAGAERINATRLKELNAIRGGSVGHACSKACVVRCSNVVNDEEGAYLTAGFEYETLVMLGSNLGVDDLDSIARMDRRCDELGIDTIETGASIAILNDAGLFEFGDSARAEALIEEIAAGTPLGRILGSGVETTARVYGIERVPAVKGQAIPGHAARSTKGWGVTYATSPQGADHTAGPVIEDPLSPVGQVERSRASQIVNTALDATGLCHFTFLYKDPDWTELILPLINALYGTAWELDDFLEMGREMLRRERAFNLGAGIGTAADALPEWMRREPLEPTGEVFDVPQDEMDGFFNF